MPTVAVTRRIVVPLTPTEDENFRDIKKPHVDRSQLSPGVRLVRVEADYLRGVWVAIFDVSQSTEPDHQKIEPWAPGLMPLVLVPRSSIELVQAQARQSKIALPYDTVPGSHLVHPLTR